MFDCLIAGVGGQGTVLASKLIAVAAMNQGFNVRTTETIGMAQRGGSVVSHTRVSSSEIYSPLIPLGCANTLIAFEPAEAARLLPYLSSNGKLVVCATAIKPFTGAFTGQAYEVEPVIGYLKENCPGALILRGQWAKGGNVKALNVEVLGAAAESGAFPFDAEVLKGVLSQLLPQRYWDLNFKAYEAGREQYHETIGQH